MVAAAENDRRDVTVRQVNWQDHGARVLEIRSLVFADTPGASQDAAADHRDQEALHVLACVDGEPVGTGQLLLPEGRITRLAVLAEYRNQGLGSLIMAELVALARQRALPVIFLHTPCEQTRFYARHGFVRQGPAFVERGTAHCRMARSV